MVFTKNDIEPGMVVALHDGTRRLVREDMVLVCDPRCGAKYANGPELHLDEYCSRMLHPIPDYDIVRVWDPHIGPLWWRGLEDL